MAVWNNLLLYLSPFAPALLMCAAMLLATLKPIHVVRLWRRYIYLSGVALACSLALLAWRSAAPSSTPDAVSASYLNWFSLSLLGVWLAVVVQFIGTIIGVFSSRYLQGEPQQARYVLALSAVLTCVHLLLLANHWLVLIAAWAMVGIALQQLLCFYRDRPFALLAGHKKRAADRLADTLLLAAAALTWQEVGSGSFTALWQHLEQHEISLALHISAIFLVLAVVLRTAMLPVHGWLIQVMEAPTPVSALLHAGVINLGGFIIIRFAPLLEAAAPARWLLIGFGLTTAVLAGLVMLTRISIKVRLAWSTVAQMGFLLLECGLGLYSLAALHLLGHSLYKANAFLSASSVVKDSTLQRMRPQLKPSLLSLIIAPLLALFILLLVQMLSSYSFWPWWWNAVLALAWAPLLWLPSLHDHSSNTLVWRALAGFSIVAGLTAATLLAHLLPLGVTDSPYPLAGIFTLCAMAALYLCLMTLQIQPKTLTRLRRWSYAGFYVDEWVTRFILKIWPTRWTVTEAASQHNLSATATDRSNSHLRSL